MKPAFVSVAAALLLSLAPAAVFAKNVSIGIYGVIDRVTFEPEVLRRTWSGYLEYLSFPSRCRAATTRRHSAAIFISGFGQEWNRQPETIGTD